LRCSVNDIKELSKHYRNEDPGEKLMIRDSIKVIRKHLQMIENKLDQYNAARNTLVKEIKRLEALSKQRGHKI